ncbi:MAG: hypothetical protein KDE47_29830 [Caldilineaceae bacterium]|nr:hypothetical protein [Caldilineaceae bacterium]
MADRVLLDTNIFITGYRRPDSLEGQVLKELSNRSELTLVLSFPLEDQIRRVGRRIGGKDWAGLILSRIWLDFNVEYIGLPENPLDGAQKMAPTIPREDLLIFLTAVRGQVNLFISGNREFMRQAAVEQHLFTCMTPGEFLASH